MVKQESGQTGINFYVSLGIGVFTVIILFFAFAIAGAQLQDSTTTTGSGVVSNQTVTLSLSGGDVTQASGAGATSISSVLVTDPTSGATIDSANYTVEGTSLLSLNGSRYAILNISSGLPNPPVLFYSAGLPNYYVSASPIDIGGVNYTDPGFGLSGSGSLWCPFGPDCATIANNDDTGLNSQGLGAENYHVAVYSTSGNSSRTTFYVSNASMASSQPPFGGPHPETCAGFEAFYGNVTGGGSITCDNMKLNVFIGNGVGQNFTFTNFTDGWENGGSGVETGHANYTPGTDPYITKVPGGPTPNYHTNLTTFTYLGNTYDDNITDIGGASPQALWSYDGMPFAFTADGGVSDVTGEYSINLALLDLTGGGDGYTTYFVDANSDNSCADVNNSLQIPLESCVLFVPSIWVSNGIGSDYTWNDTGLDNWISEYDQQSINVSASYSFQTGGEGNSIVANFTQALDDNSSQVSTWLVLGGLVVLLSIIGVVLLIIRRASGGESA